MAVTIDSNGSPGQKASASSITTTFVNTAGTRLIIMGTICANGASPTVSSAEYPTGSSLGAAITSKNNTDVGTAIFEKIAPATGSNGLKITYSITNQVTLGFASFVGDSASASTAATATSGTGTAVDISKATTANGVLVGCYSAGSAFTSVSNTQILLQNIDNTASGDNGGGNTRATTGGTDHLTAVVSSSDSWTACAIEIPVAVGGGADTPSVTDAITVGESATPNLRSFINVTE